VTAKLSFTTLPRIVSENPATFAKKPFNFHRAGATRDCIVGIFLSPIKGFRGHCACGGLATMPNDNLARLEQFASDSPPSPNAAEPLGRVVSVSGSQVMVEFSTAAFSSGEPDLTVGAFLGIWNGRTLVVGSLCDISLHKLADGQQSDPASGRVDCWASSFSTSPAPDISSVAS
jgi:hypothetical protein